MPCPNLIDSKCAYIRTDVWAVISSRVGDITVDGSKPADFVKEICGGNYINCRLYRLSKACNAFMELVKEVNGVE